MRAVRAMAAWVSSAGGNTSAFHHPGIAKSRLIALGYISARSAHASGIAIDLTLITRSAPKTTPLEPRKAPRAPANGASTNRPSSPLQDGRKTGTCRDTGADPTDPAAIDMGTLFDCFDPQSRTYASGLTLQQNRWRKTLVDAMERQGFKNYSREWWHFTYRNTQRGPSLDQPIE
jgi:D-alanyl-D-alanine dipeptidase